MKKHLVSILSTVICLFTVGGAKCFADGLGGALISPKTGDHGIPLWIIIVIIIALVLALATVFLSKRKK